MTPLVDLAWTQFWQVTAVAAGVGLTIRLSCRQRPHLAHVLWLVVLVKCLTPTVWSSPTSVFSWATRHSRPAMPITSVPIDTGIGPSAVPESRPAKHHGTSGHGEVASSTNSHGSGSVLRGTTSEPAANPDALFTQARFELIMGFSWIFGVSAYALYAILASVHCCRTIRSSRMPADERLSRLAVDLSRRLGIRRTVRLWVTCEPLGPLTFGWIRPTIVLPEVLTAHRSNAELEPLLAHELVHVRRGDALVGLLQAAAQCLWWFHPLIWWANRRIVFERERCCDEEVVAGLALEPARYARSLVSVLELKRQLRWLSALPGARPFEITQRRLEHIMLGSDRFRSRMPHRYWLTSIAVALTLVPGAGLTESSVSVASSPHKLQSDRLPEPVSQSHDAKAKELNHAVEADNRFNPAEVEMHVIGVYMPKNGLGKDSGRVDVEIRPTAKPVVVVLTSYSSVDWHIKLADGARIKKAIVSGYFSQEIKGLPPDVPVVNQSYFPEDGSRRKQGWFWASEWNTPQWREMVRRLNNMTGLPVAAFQAKSDCDAFVVDGKLGRDQGQNGLKAKAPTPKELTLQELLATSANAELHVVGIYFPDMNKPGRPVDVEVRATTRPVVLVLTSYMEAIWHIKCDPAARIKAVIIGSRSPQEVEGIPADVPVHQFCPDARSYFFDRRGPESDRQSFFAYQWNTLEYRRMVEKLNDLTGLRVSTFQGAYSGTSFVIDGSRGRNHTQKERKPRPTLPKEVKPEELLAASAQADLHIVGIYNAGAGNGAPVDVEVRPTSKPIVLALASYGSVLWNVRIAKEAQIKAVIVGGYYEQEIEGIPANIPIACRAFFPSRNEGYYWGFDWNSKECRSMVAKLNDMTGQPVSTFQGEYTGTSFVVDGTRGRELAQTKRQVDGTKSRAIAKHQPKPEENALADVADIPSQEFRAAGDANKRYLLIGPKKNAKPPPDGYGLLVIMPGGDGSADFHPFVKRIYKNALSDRYLAAQPIAVQWAKNQEIVWPTKTTPVAKMKFGTEEFVAAVIEDVAKKHKLDRKSVFSLSWSSSGPAAYATSLQNNRSIMGSFIAMSVFNPKFLPELKQAKGHAYFLYHSQQDRVCPYRMAEQAKNVLLENGAKVRLETYEGGHGWRGNIYRDIRNGIKWLVPLQN
jgi:beta-lactamase regulating signal transducer with metallopeptidase domain/predicted esterase